MRYNELTIFTDIDGTLLIPGIYKIPKRNLAAIESFLADGGRFAIATGRTYEWTYEIAGQVGVNFPCVLYNGGVIFDFEKERSISQEYLPQTAYEYVKTIAAAMPWIEIVPVSDGPIFDAQDEMCMLKHMRSGDGSPYRVKNWHENRMPWFKVLLCVPPVRKAELLDFISKMELSDVHTTMSSEYVVELLPGKTSKGSALEKMYAALGLRREKTVAIGDFYNDFEMIKAAGIGACVEGSPDELVAASKYITCPCEDGAVADLIEKLKRDYP